MEMIEMLVNIHQSAMVSGPCSFQFCVTKRQCSDKPHDHWNTKCQKKIRSSLAEGKRGCSPWPPNRVLFPGHIRVSSTRSLRHLAFVCCTLSFFWLRGMIRCLSWNDSDIIQQTTQTNMLGLFCFFGICCFCQNIQMQRSAPQVKTRLGFQHNLSMLYFLA